MDQAKSLSKDQQEVEHVLKQYLDLFNSGGDFFKFLIAQNGVLEWFGRTIKGNQKIHDFFKYEVRSQYDHLFFDTTKACEPFECKPSHMRTKDFPVEDNSSLNKKSIDCSFESDNTPLDTQSSTTPSAKDRRTPITPPSSAKRFKHEDHHTSNHDCTPLLNLDDYFERKETPIQLVPQPARTQISSHSGYSELRYLETVGVLRSSVQPEYRSFRNSIASNGNDAWDRETKIQISYRIRLQDNDVHFALIVYQNVRQYSAVSRRNLMSEFEEVASKERLCRSGSSTKGAAHESPQVKRKISRRLRLF